MAPKGQHRCSSFIIEGGRTLKGEITASANKNAVLPMIAAALLTDELVILEAVPNILDLHAMLAILTHLGVEWNLSNKTLHIQAKNIKTNEIPRDLCLELRSSFLFVAPLLIRCDQAKLSPPGGDMIGRRRLDAHFYGLKALGVVTKQDEFEFSIDERLQGRELFFDEASVTATEHILIAAVLAEGQTILRNAASEPHVQDLARFLVNMGADINGIGSNTLTVTGVDKLHGVRHRIIPDHIEVGSFLALAAATGGSITINNVIHSHFWMIQRVFQRFNLGLHFSDGNVVLSGGQSLQMQKDLDGAIARIDDGPWPQFPSDLMSVMIVLATQAEGMTLFFEKMYESRLYFVDRLIQIGANIIFCDPHRALVTGPTMLRGQRLSSPDIRAGMALLIAAFCAKGISRIDNAWVIDRGYEKIEEKLQALGGHIEREKAS